MLALDIAGFLRFIISSDFRETQYQGYTEETWHLSCYLPITQNGKIFRRRVKGISFDLTSIDFIHMIKNIAIVPILSAIKYK